MRIKEIIEDAESVGFYRVAESEILKMLIKFAELTVKRASLSANEQDAIDAERYRYIKERVYSDMESWTLPEIEEPKDYKYSIKVSRFDYAVDKAIANKKGGV